LRAQIDVRLRPTNTVPSFLMPFTDPELDVDVSGQMAGHAAVEMGLTQARSRAPKLLFHHVRQVQGFSPQPRVEGPQHFTVAAGSRSSEERADS
jgi:hypothetical protein